MIPVFPCICFHIENLPNSISIGTEEQKGIVSHTSRRSTFQKEYESSKTKMYKGFSMIPLNRNLFLRIQIREQMLFTGTSFCKTRNLINSLVGLGHLGT